MYLSVRPRFHIPFPHLHSEWLPTAFQNHSQYRHRSRPPDPSQSTGVRGIKYAVLHNKLAAIPQPAAAERHSIAGHQQQCREHCPQNTDDFLHDTLQSIFTLFFFLIVHPDSKDKGRERLKFS